MAGGRQGFAGLLIVSFVKGINKSYEITTISSSGNVGFELMLITCLPQGSTVFVDGLGKWRQENRQKAWPHSALELKCGTWMQVLEWPSMPVPSPENYGHEFCYVRHGQPSPPLPSHNAKHCILKGLPSFVFSLPCPSPPPLLINRCIFFLRVSHRYDDTLLLNTLIRISLKQEHSLQNPNTRIGIRKIPLMKYY